ncbi:MAG TPA: HAD family phosphatase [Acidobacteriota bacterium]|nr:HAD family phosphatase [Acidobacteriota bacterium]
MKDYVELPGIGVINDEYQQDFIDLEVSGDGAWRVGDDGVSRILAPRDRKVELIVFEDKTLALVKSAVGPQAYYPLLASSFEPPAEAVLMDLDGTSVRSEHFWMWIIEQSIARLKGDPDFRLEPEDEPHVSGHSVSEHLRYCIDKYAPGGSLEEARRHYFEITSFEMNEIAQGRGRSDAFRPSPGLKEFLTELKARGVKIGLVTSGLYEKAWPEILAAFRTLNMGNPLDFYDAIITAGDRLAKGRTGTLGELAPKPHPWLYAETAYVGLGVDRSRRNRVIGLEDSGAGVVSIRLAGFAAIGIDGGNIKHSGVRPLLHGYCNNLLEALPVILG